MASCCVLTYGSISFLKDEMKQALTLLALLSLPWSLVAEPKTSATSAPFGLDINSGMRETAGNETFAYDSNWYANGSKVAYKISVNGKDLAQCKGCGEVVWETHRPGVYEVVASAYEGGVLADSSLTATFEFKGKDLVNADVAFVSDESILYDGTAKTPSVSVVLKGETLIEGVDYELGYEENIQPGVGKVVIRGKGRFSDEIEVPFTIVPAGICVLDIESGVREASATEMLNFDSTWLGTSSVENRVSVNGVQIGAGTGVGAVVWSPIVAGDYTLEYRAYENGVEQEARYAAQFHVSQGELPLEIELNQDQFMFADGVVVPQVTVRYQGTALREGTDYTLTFVDNDHSGLAKVIVTGMGIYLGTVEKQFRILPSATLRLDIQDGVRVIAGGGVEQIAYENAWDGGMTVKVAVNGVNVIEGGTVGTYEWTPAGIGLYTLTHTTYNGEELGNMMSAQFYIPGSLDDAEVVLDFDECLFDGTAKCPTPVVMKGGVVLTQGLDYEVVYQNNVAAGAATVVVVVANGERIERTFTIRPTGICSLDIESGVREAKAVEALTYDGLWKGVADADYRIWIDGAELSAGSGYGEAIWNPRAVGDHVATCRTYVDGAKVGDDLSAKFHVSGKDLVNASVKLNDEMILYDGTAREPKATITYDGKMLVEGEDYELSYRDNIEPGKGILTITGNGEFVDVVEVPFTIRPAGICTLDIESGCRKVKVEELLAFDYKWKGDTAGNTRMAIRVNDVVLTNITGVGDAVWKPACGGNYVVTLRTYIDDYLQDEDILTAYFGVEGGKSKYDATVVYDGKGHTVNTNALTAAKIGSDAFAVLYSLDGATNWQSEPFVYTNAGQYAFWYMLQNANYNDYVHQVQLTITPKPISDSTVVKTVTPELFVFDGTVKTPTVTITDESVFRWQFVEAYAKGDVNGDGVLSQADADAIDQYVAYLGMDEDMKPLFEEYELVGEEFSAADYNSDGVIDVLDVTDLEASFVTLKEAVDYEIVYENNIEAGAAKVIVTGTGNYGGKCAMSFETKPVVTVKNLNVTPIAPWGMALDFDVEGAAANYTLEVKAITVDGVVTNVAKTLSGDVGCSNGAHRVYWNTAKDGITIARTNVSVTVIYNWPLYCVIELANGSSAASYSVSYLDAPPSGGFNTTEYKTTKLVLKRVDAGTFTMGDSNKSDNQPHTVTLTKPFYMGLFEVTQKQWELVMGSNPCSSTSYGKGDVYPVHYVSYNRIRGSSEGAKWPATNSVDATSFLGKLRERTKLDFDLPTEAQWEYTCRARTTTTYSYGDSANGDCMWYLDNSSGGTKEVGTKKANPWGFYDMHGNVWEWCLDWCDSSLSGGEDPVGSSSSSDSYRVLRGGSWIDGASNCASSHRGGGSPSYEDHSKRYFFGFRISRILP